MSLQNHESFIVIWQCWVVRVGLTYVLVQASLKHEGICTCPFYGNP